jgi:GH15 family glucan-1,4-alpha-glucosidase
MASKIEDYALIGDCETAALVDRNGSIDWLCWPDFSSDACFAALLGTEENGYWKIAPAEREFRTTRRYRDHTLILETTFETAEGAVRLIEFMPARGTHSDVFRIVQGIRGKVAMRMDLSLRFDFGRTIPWVTHIPDGVRAVAGPNLAVLHASVPVHGENLTTVAEFSVTRGERVHFSLTYGLSYEEEPRKIDPEKALKVGEQFWRRWSGRLKHKGRYREAIERSLITLKALTFRPTGGIVAAATTSLPEAIGGVRNWDYRFCWLRDTTFTLPGRIGSCARWPEAPTRCRSCTASKANGSLWNGKSAGSRGMKARVRCGLAMLRRSNCNWTFTEKCSTVSSIRSTVSTATAKTISASWFCSSNISSRSGICQTKVSGRYAGTHNISLIRR